DPDEWRGSLRQALATGRKEDLEKLAPSAPIEKLPPTTLILWGNALEQKGAIRLAEQVLRKGQQLHPADFWINHDLASILARQMKPPQLEVIRKTQKTNVSVGFLGPNPGLPDSRLEEAIGFYRAALALRPLSPGVHSNLGNALHDQGHLD